MPKSMTAFSRAEKHFPFGRVVCELRSINHRYLDINLKLSGLIRQLEPELRDALKHALARGKVEGFVQLDVQGAQRQELALNEAYLQSLLEANEKVRLLGKIGAEEKASTFLAWPGVIEANTTLDDCDQKAVLAFILDVISQLIDSREQEGDAIKGLLLAQLEEMKRWVNLLKEKLSDIRQSQDDRLREKLASLNIAVDQERLEQEIVYLAQKGDVAEELDRLVIHAKAIEDALAQEAPCGRRLDFLMQELNREANTLGSKSYHALMSEASVELKVIIEKMREQVQNLE